MVVGTAIQDVMAHMTTGLLIEVEAADMAIELIADLEALQVVIVSQ